MTNVTNISYVFVFDFFDSVFLQSYPIDVSTHLRGRAIVFTVTVDRPGWDHDVKYMYKCFRSLDIEVERVYNPNKEVGYRGDQ